MDFEATYNNQVGIQPSSPTIEPQQQVREATFNNQPVIQPLPPTIEPQQRSAAARGESINANLCEAGSRHAIERTLSSASTKELVTYVEGLKKGSYAFNWTISGYDAARHSDLDVGLRSPTTKQPRKCGLDWNAKAVCTLTR